jgi:hypothetical protein
MGIFGAKSDSTPSVHDVVTAWLREENIKLEKLPPQDGVEFAYLLDYPPPGPAAKIHIMRPKGRHLLVIGMGVQLSPPHQQAFQGLMPPARERLVRVLRKTVYENGRIGFAAAVENGILTRWTLDLVIYDDALGRDSLNGGLRMLFTKHLEIIETLNIELSAPPDTRSQATTGLAGYM